MSKKPGTIQLVLYDAYHSVIQRVKKQSTATHPMVGWMLSRAIAHFNTAKSEFVRKSLTTLKQPQGPQLDQVLMSFDVHKTLYTHGDWTVQTDMQQRKISEGIYVVFPRIEVYYDNHCEYTWNYFWEGKKVLPLRVERKLVALKGPDGQALIERGFKPKPQQDYQYVTLMQFTDNDQNHNRVLTVKDSYIYIETDLGADQGGGLCIQ